MGGKAGRPTDALSMLDRCHRQMDRRIGELRDATAALVAGRATEDDHLAIEEIAQFLARTTARHTADEEESLFPRLARDPQLALMLDQLTAEHRDHERLLADLRSSIDTWRHRPSAESVAALAHTVAELNELYLVHILREDRDLVPAIQRVLSADDLAGVFREMQTRRGK